MSNIQVRNVDEHDHEALRRRAESVGMSISQYVLELIRRDLRRPARAEWLTMLRSLPATGLSHEATMAVLDEGRNER
jgi:antitoxin FitA